MKHSTKLLLFTVALVALLVCITGAQTKAVQNQDETKYQDLKSRGLIPQPVQVPGPRNSEVPFKPEVCGNTGLAIPLDETFTRLRLNPPDTSFRIAPFTNGTPPQYRNDDGSTDSLPLSFTFTFFGQQWHKVYINNNGNISFSRGFGDFTSTGFPTWGYDMIAAFWADVDTRNFQSGLVYYKSEAHRFTIIWDSVGYYSNMADKRNTFQIIITDGTDPVVGVGNNVCISYGPMQWTTGSASGGINGFGGTPATVGINRGDSTNYALIGRFDHAGFDYDGPGGRNDGVYYLNNKRFCFNIAQGLGTVRGNVFRDDNANCVRDPNEPGLQGWTVRLNPGSRYTTTDSAGNYFLSFLPPGTYTLSEVLKTNWTQTCPAAPGTHTVVLDSGQTISGKNFGNRPIANVQDLAATVGGGIARPGFQKFYGIRYDNKGTVDVPNATVKFYLAAPTTHEQASPGGTYNPAGYVQWNLGTVAAGSTGWLWERVRIQPSTPLNTPLTTSVLIEPLTGDANPADNRDWETQIVRGSFDPNDKAVTPSGTIQRTDTLQYTIRFQNTGTDTAFNIRVVDSLNANLDIATFIPAGASHPYTYNLGQGTVEFAFNNILLPDSNVNEPGSHGFVKFKIRPLSTAGGGTAITNRAGIYFDFNAPVITNTVTNTIFGYTVYPGDANNDGIVDVRDILPLGRFYGVTGAARTGGSLTWGPQVLGTPWSPTPEACYADCNGDGTVDATDVNGIINNWYRTVTGPEAPQVNRLAVCEELLREIDAQQPVSGGMLEIRRAVVSYMTRELGVVFNYTLEQNWPNPFNPSTTIRFSVAENVPVATLSVYNLLGQLVWEKKLTDVLPGKHEVIWSGETLGGKKAASSIYIYKLSAGSFTSVKRMLLIK